MAFLFHFSRWRYLQQALPFKLCILNFDMFHSISLNWGVVAGILCGTPFSFYALAHKKWWSRNVAIVGFVFFTMYQVMLYFLIGPDTEYNQLWPPMWFRGVGTAILYVVLAYTLEKIFLLSTIFKHCVP